MLKSILTTALRNILRNRSFSLINLIGLSVSMSLGLLVMMVVIETFTYDDFHQDANRIYRVNTNALRTEGGSEPYASAPLPIARVLREDYTFAEKVVGINRQLRGDAIYGNVNVPIRGMFADPTFLEVFNFPLQKGNPATVLTEPNSLVLTQEAAEKIFGKQEPLGQTITITGKGEYQVTGVLKKFAGNTHFEFEVLGSTAALPLLEKEGKIMASVDDWNNYYMGYVYFKLKEGRKTAEVEQALAEMASKYYKNLKLETRDRGYAFYLHPLPEITPGPELSNQMGHGMPDMVLIFLGSLAGVVMLMACFNYTNLMIAKSLSRAREIGVRKVVGAQRFQVFFQFVGEAVVFSVIALGFSYLLLQFLKPAFMQLNIAREFSADLQEGYSLYIYFLLFAIGVGAIAGLLPAGYLSAFKPVSVLKDSNVKVYSRMTFRKILIVTQFTLSLTFIIVVLVIYNQVNFMLNRRGVVRPDGQGVHAQHDPLDLRHLDARERHGQRDRQERRRFVVLPHRRLCVRARARARHRGRRAEERRQGAGQGARAAQQRRTSARSCCRRRRRRPRSSASRTPAATRRTRSSRRPSSGSSRAA